jgi:hypothetical protein
MAEETPDPAGETPKPIKRSGRCVKKKRGEPAVFIPGAAAQPFFDPQKVAEDLRLWSFNGKDRYFSMPRDDEPNGEARSLSREDVNMRLRVHRVQTRPAPGKLHSQADEFFIYLQENRSVVWAGSVAGMPVGVHVLDGSRIAVLRTFRLIEPVPGDWQTIRAWLESFFNDDGTAQLPFFFAWLKMGIEAVRDGLARPGYILAIAGPADTGKSFLQTDLVTPLLGGREANPLPYLRDRDSFNDDVCGAEHLSMGELKGCKLDGQSRAELGEALKDLAVNPKMRLRAQYSSAIMVRPLRRVSVSLNDEPDKLKAFPALTPDFADKVLLLLCKPGALPIATMTAEGWRALGDAVARELPAFAHFLSQWEIPADLLSGAHVGRFGHTNYHHPTLEAELFGQTAESELLWIVDNTPSVLDDKSRGWHAADDIRQWLLDGPHGSRAAKLLHFPGSAGTYLQKLAAKFPERFTKKAFNYGNRWQVRPLPPPL